uniref:Endonuclease n=1 Tax=Romanomermis culicivorax TaxID=13658 RepID=A0A915IQ34_ROMCU
MRRRPCKVPWFCTAIGFAIGAFLGKNFEALSDYFPLTLGYRVHAAEIVRHDLLPALPADIVLSKKDDSPDQIISPPSRASEIMRFGYPGFETLRTHEDFLLSYDRRNRVANWVMEHLTPEGIILGPDVNRKKSNFSADSSIHEFFRSTNDDYRRSGYDRGHMAAAANHHKSQSAIDQTFLLSNAAPQVGEKFNRGKWSDLENHVRAVVRRSRNVYVCTGPLYLPRREVDGKLYVKYEVIGKNNVAVPTHFFKVVLVDTVEGHLNVESYIMPNAEIDDDTPLKAFQVPVEAIERAAGFLIFESLPKSQLKLINGKQSFFINLKLKDETEDSPQEFSADTLVTRLVDPEIFAQQ